MLDSQELDDRLERWANWARSPIPGAVGGAIGYMREYLDPPADSDLMTDEIVITERAIARAKMEDRAYCRVIKKYYLGRLSFAEIAGSFNVSERSIARLFDEAKGRIGWHIFEIEAVFDKTQEAYKM